MIRRLLLALLAFFFTQPALAQSCDTANRYSFAFANQAAATLSYGSTHNYTATNGSGATRAFSMQVSQNGLTNTQVAGNQMPQISTLITGADATKRDLVVGGVFGSRTTSINSTTRVVTVTMTFAVPIREIALTVHDIDYTLNQYRDWLGVTGSDGTNAYTGTIALGSGATSAAVGPTSVPVDAAAGTAVGITVSGNNSEDGTILARFAQPVTSVTLKYGNYPLQAGETATGQQAMGIAGFTFCPMPSVSMAKTSAPSNGALGAFNLPDNDVIYTIAVTNSGGSTVDASSIVLSDALPANTTFLNSAFDGTTTLPVKLVGSAGLTLAAANITYRRTGTSTFNYTPVSGYDPLVAEVRLTPGGTMAANSSFSIQFKAKIR